MLSLKEEYASYFSCFTIVLLYGSPDNCYFSELKSICLPVSVAD